MDLYPTVCELASVEPPEHLEGESLLQVLQDPQAKSDSFALSQYARFRDKYMGRALRDDRYRFVAWIETETSRVVQRELYDHKIDPGETRNLAGEASNADLVAELEAKLHAAFELQSN